MHGIFGTAHFPSCRQLSSLVHVFLSPGCTAEQSQDRKSSVGSACAVCVPGRMESDPSHRENASLILHHSFLPTHFFPPWSGYFLSMGQAWTRHPALALVGTLTALWNTEAPSQQYLTEMFQNKTLSSFSKGAKRAVSTIHFWEPSYMASEQLYKLLCVWCGTSQHQRLEVI